MYKLILYLLAGACFSLPFSFRISTIFLMAFSVLTIIYCVYEKSYDNKNKIIQLFSLPSILFLIVVVGWIFTSHKYDATNLIVKYIPYFVMSLAYIFSAKEIKENAPKYISVGIIAGITSTILYLLAIIIQKFYLSEEDNIFRLFSFQYTYNRFIEPIDSHPTYLAILIIVSNYFIYNSKKIVPFLRYILLGINVFGLLFTMSRIGLIIFSVQIILLFFFLNKREKMVYLFVLICCIFSSIYIYKYKLADFYILQRLSIELKWDINPDNSSSIINNREADDSRIARWGAITKTILQKPIVGYGTGSEDYILQKTYLDANLKISHERQYNTHNQFLFIWLENGLIGLSILVFFFIFNVKSAYERNDLFSFLFLFSLLLVCIFENYLNRTMGVLAASIFLTFMKSLKR